MKKILLGLLFLGLCVGIGQAAGSDKVTQILDAARQHYAVPALGGAVLTDGGLVVEGVSGAGTVTDCWHLGSDTKAMTASVLGSLVQDGKLQWTTTVGEVFGSDIHLSDDQARITMLDLLHHRSGLRANIEWSRIPTDIDIHRQRMAAVRQAFAEPLGSSPGSQFLYSNLGYVVAATMGEVRSGQTWETLIQQRLFEPLGMTACFGPVAAGMPPGHDPGGRLDNHDNPPVMSPAGRVNCTMLDWSRFLTDQLRGARGEKALLQPGTYRMLQTPAPGEDYAAGWIATTRSWGGHVLNHNGSNTHNYCDVWLAPERNFAVLTVCNQGGDTAFHACDAAVGGLLRAYQEGDLP